MTAVFATSSVAADLPRLELARRCREICLAHESTAFDTAVLEQALMDALKAVRERYGPACVNDEDLDQIFQREAARVTDARILAELLAPRLLAAMGAPQSRETRPAPAPPPAPFPASSPPTATADPPGIADLLDGMLALDHDARTRRPR